MANKMIWKFPLRTTDEQTVEMPVGAKLLHVGVQAEQVNLWAEVDPDAPYGIRTMLIYGTGHPMQDTPQTYVGTYMLSGGKLVFHVYDATTTC